MKIDPKENWNFKPIFSSLKLEKNFFMQGEFWAKVKKNIGSTSILVVKEKEFAVKNLANLLEGENIKLLPKEYSHRMELEILERVWEFSQEKERNNMFSKTSLSLEQFLENSLSNSASNLENIFSLLKTFFPVLDWNLDTPYFFWEWEDGKGEAFFSKEEQKLFLKFFRPKLGKVELVFQYSLPEAPKLNVFLKLEKQEVYCLCLQRLELLKKYFIDERIQLNKLVIQLQANWKESKGWKV